MPQAIPAVIAAISYVGTAATAVVAGTATLAQIATVAAVGIGAGVGSTAAASALTPQIASQGAAVRWDADPDAPLRFPFGRVGVKGSIKDAAVYGPDRMYVSFACTVGAAGPIRSFVSFRAGDYYMSFNGAGMATTEPYAGEMWLSTRLGAQPDTALSLPSGLKSGAAFPGWGSDRKLSGSPAYMVTLGENSKRTAYDGKIPAFVVTIEGLFCYDPRLDSTYPGGSGSCLLSDPATWVWTQNPILFGLKWALGLWEGPTGKGAPQVDYQVGGIGAKVDGIHLASFVTAANVSDSNGWTSAAYPSTDDDKAQILDGFLKAGGAMYAEIAGKIACIHRAAPRATVFTVTARDTAGPVEIDTASSKLNRINTIRPRYWAEDQEWEMTALPEVTSSAWQIEDGQGVAVKRTRGADYTFVVDPKQARELACLEIGHSREGIRGRVPLRPYMDPEPGNCFIFDEPDFALSNVKCFVLNVEDDTESDTVIVTFETETDGNYPFAYGQAGSPPPPQELAPFDPRFVSQPTGAAWTITLRPAAPDGSQQPGFDVVGAVENDTATGLIVEWSLAGADQWTSEGGIWPPTTTAVPIVGVQSGEGYDIGLSYVRGQNQSARTIFGPYTAGGLIGSNDAELLAELARIASDDWLTTGEKPEVERQYLAIDAEYAGLSAQGLAVGATGPLTAYVAAFTALETYMASLSPTWFDMTADTAIDGDTFNALFVAYYAARADLRVEISAAIAADADAAAASAASALAAIATIQSDAILSRGEKPEIIRLWDAIYSEKAGLDAQGAAGGTGAAAALTAYDAAWLDLSAYLTGLSPFWADTASDTPIDPTDFNAAFSNYYVAKQALLNALLGVIGLDAQTALARIAIIDSDAVLSRGEKPEIIRLYAAMAAESAGIAAQALAIGATSQRTAYLGAFTDLSVYLAGLSPAYNDTTVDTPIVPTDFNGAFTAYYAAKQVVMNAMLGIVSTDATAALARLTVIASNSWLSAGEKPGVIREYQAIAADYAPLIAQATALGVSYSAYQTATDALSAYLSGLSPAWDLVTVDTPIVGATFLAKFTAAYDARSALRSALTAAVASDASAALARLAALANDNILSREEKVQVNQDYLAIDAEYPGLSAAAATAGVTTERTAYINAFNALTTYLAGLYPTWYDRTQDTVIVGTTFVSKFTDYTVAKTALQSAMANAGGGSTVIIRTATASGVIGPLAYHPLASAALTPLTAYPAGGTFTVEVPALFAISNVDRTDPTASGQVRVVVYHSVDGIAAVTGWVNCVGPASGEWAAQVASALNVTVVNGSAGNIRFELQVIGFGANTGSDGVIDASLKVTYVK